MSGFPILDLVVGIIFIYFLLSIISSSAVEILLSSRKLRAKTLEKWLSTIFDKKLIIGGKNVSLGQAIMDHCSVTALSKTGKAPSYIDAKNFTSALLEKITFDPEKPLSIANDIKSFEKTIQDSNVLSTELKRVFLIYINEAKDTYQSWTEKKMSELDLFRSKIENWFDTSMERVGGNFKRNYLRFWTFIIALITSFLLNADTIAISKYLYHNKEASAKLANDAMSATADSSLQKSIDKLKQSRQFNDSEDSATLEELEKNITDRVADIREAKSSLTSEIPLGWSVNPFCYEKGKPNPFFTAKGNPDLLAWLIKIVGVFVTVLAIMMGAPFWFDVLNKISNVRSAGKKPETTANT